MTNVNHFLWGVFIPIVAIFRASHASCHALQPSGPHDRVPRLVKPLYGPEPNLALQASQRRTGGGLASDGRASRAALWVASMARRRRNLCRVALLLVVAAGPEAPAEGQGQATGASASSLAPVSAADAAAATYRDLPDLAVPVTLVAGRWEGDPYVPGGAARPTVTMVGDLAAIGDLNGDGDAETAVLLAQGGGGSGEFVHVVLLARRGGNVVHLATAPLGDRVSVRRLTPEPLAIAIEVVQPSASDARCCPGDLATRTFDVRDGRLVERPAVVSGRLSLEALAATDWTLTHLGANEPAPRQPVVSLRVDGGRIAGLAGCNNYTAGVSTGVSPGEMTTGAAAATRKMCPPDSMALEARYLRQLAGVRRFGFLAGKLALTWEHEGGTGVMLFAAPATSAAPR